MSQITKKWKREKKKREAFASTRRVLFIFQIRLFIHSVNEGFTCVICSLIERFPLCNAWDAWSSVTRECENARCQTKESTRDRYPSFYRKSLEIILDCLFLSLCLFLCACVCVSVAVYMFIYVCCSGSPSGWQRCSCVYLHWAVCQTREISHFNPILDILMVYKMPHKRLWYHTCTQFAWFLSRLNSSLQFPHQYSPLIIIKPVRCDEMRLCGVVWVELSWVLRWRWGVRWKFSPDKTTNACP